MWTARQWDETRPMNPIPSIYSTLKSFFKLTLAPLSFQLTISSGGVNKSSTDNLLKLLPDLIEGSRRMTSFTIDTKVSLMRIIGPMTGNACCRSLFHKGIPAAVTGYTSNLYMCAGQRVVRLTIVIEEPMRPIAWIVASLAVGSKKAFMPIVFAVAVIAGKGCFPIKLALVAGGALLFGMNAQKRKPA